MKRKTAVAQRLLNIPVLINDTTPTSPDYFQISDFPLRLTAGKNLIKIRGNSSNLRAGSPINIEVLDYNSNPIYSEIISYIDEDQSRVIAIYIYSETSPGDATIIITGESKNVPAIWRNRPNIRWTRTVPVNPTADNTTEIIFGIEPTISVSEQVSVQLDRNYSSTQFPQLSTGTVAYNSINNTPAITLSGAKFTQDMVGGTLTVTSPQNPQPTPIFNISSTTYKTTIKKVLSDTTALLSTEYVVYTSQSLSTHTYTLFDPSAYTLDYEAIPTYIPTQNSESVAIVEISNLEPVTGDVSRIKVYTSGKGTVGTWELANDIELDETELFISSTSSIEPYFSIGTFTTQSIIDTYWTARTFIGKTETTAPTLQWSTSSLANATDIVSAVNITPKNAVHLFYVSESYAGKFIENSQYKVTFDAYAQRDSFSGNQPPLIYVYVSGSAFEYDVTDYYNQELPINLGKQIGRIEVAAAATRIDDYVVNFTADQSGTGILIFVIVSGQWQIADVRTTTDNDPGYTPNYTRIRTEIPTKHKSANQLSFKIEYYNVAGTKSKLQSFVNNLAWQGGNRYIDGDYSMLTGSLYVADSLESGVAISGYKDTGFVRSLGYDGFAAGNPGFLLWSGSALSGSAGTKGGVPYSGVGLELYADANNYFRYATQPSELDVRTETFFLGDPNSQYISGSAGNLEISSSGFFLSSNGSVTASAFLAVSPNGDILFNTDSEYVDGVNIGRVVYFNRSEYSFTGDLNLTPQTASIFETFILPGETRMQLSVTTEFKNDTAANRTIRANFWIQSASITDVVASSNGYDTWSTPQQLNSAPIAILTTTASVTRGNSRTINVATTPFTALTNCQGKYVRVYMVIDLNNPGTGTDVVKMKNFVYRTSRSVGGSITAPAVPIIS